MRTFSEKPANAQATRRWWVVDAKGQALGRVASRVASVLSGKHKPTYTPHVDTGDFVIVVNAAEVRLSGNKARDKHYYTHSGHPGGIKAEAYGDLAERKPERPLTLAVKGMLPRNVLGRHMIEKLKIYSGAEHPHAAQKPEPLAL